MNLYSIENQLTADSTNFLGSYSQALVALAQTAKANNAEFNLYDGHYKLASADAIGFTDVARVYYNNHA